MTYTITTDDTTRTLILLIEHFASYGVEMTSSDLSDGVITLTTDAPLTAEQIEHLSLTVV